MSRRCMFFFNSSNSHSIAPHFNILFLLFTSQSHFCIIPSVVRLALLFCKLYYLCLRHLLLLPFYLRFSISAPGLWSQDIDIVALHPVPHVVYCDVTYYLRSNITHPTPCLKNPLISSTVSD